MLPRWFSLENRPVPLTEGAWIAWALIVFFVPFQLHYNYILNIFYYSGTPFNDGGLFAQMLWHNDWLLTTPYAYENRTFFVHHFSPFLNLVNLLSYYLPTYKVEFLAGFTASLYASLGLALFVICCSVVKPARHWQLALLALIAMGFAFNTVIGLGMWMPHFEYAIPLGLLLFFFCYARGYSVLAAVFFIFVLSLREDGGLQICVLLGSLAAIKYWEKRSLAAIQPLLILNACAFAYSAAAFTIVHLICNYYHQTPVASFIYIGNPPLSRISWAVLENRAFTIFRHHIYLWAGFIVTCYWAVRTRNPYYMVAYIANIPWFFINWFANNDNTGELYAYYGFPFITCMAWPMLAVLWQYGNTLTPRVIKEALALQAILIALAVTAWDYDAGGVKFGPSYYSHGITYQVKPVVEHRELIHEFLEMLDSGTGNLGSITAESALLGIFPQQYQGKYIARVDQARPTDSLFFMDSHYSGSAPISPKVMDIITKNHLEHRYRLTGTTIYLYSNRGYDELKQFSSHFEEISDSAQNPHSPALNKLAK